MNERKGRSYDVVVDGDWQLYKLNKINFILNKTKKRKSSKSSKEKVVKVINKEKNKIKTNNNKIPMKVKLIEKQFVIG